LLSQPPLGSGSRRLAVMLSAWDKARGEGRSPQEFLEQKVPLLHQYLEQNAEKWTFSTYGVSAQGGDYDKTTPEGPSSLETQELRELDAPSKRIQLVEVSTTSHDLTKPIEWLLS
jgi:hypothetical protein